MGTKVCNGCQRDLPATLEYFFAAKTKSGLRPRCKECMVNASNEIRKEKHKRFDEIYDSINREELTKTCVVCNNEYPATLECFFKSVTGLYGLRSKCKGCFTADAKVRKQTPEYKQKSSESGKKWYAANKEKCAARWQRYYKAKRNYHLERAKDYKAENPEKVKHNDRRKDRRRRKEQSNLLTTFTVKQWQECQEIFKHECAYCGKKKKLTQDHFIALVHGGEYTRDNIVPACINCNSSKNSKDFFEWYPEQSFYSKIRKQKILKYLNHDGKSQQLTLLALGL